MGFPFLPFRGGRTVGNQFGRAAAKATANLIIGMRQMRSIETKVEELHKGLRSVLRSAICTCDSSCWDGRSLGTRSVGKRTSLTMPMTWFICCRVGAEQALTAMQRMMLKLKLTVDENKRRVCHLPEEKFDFLGYTFGRRYSLRRSRFYRLFQEAGTAHLSSYQRRNRA
jgi:hypothetical protein